VLPGSTAKAGCLQEPTENPLTKGHTNVTPAHMLLCLTHAVAAPMMRNHCCNTHLLSSCCRADCICCTQAFAVPCCSQDSSIVARLHCHGLPACLRSTCSSK
jgi:hypothetical protein